MTKSRRQQYGLGSFVKKFTRPIKKVLKSPLGKAALIGGLGMIPFGATGATGWGRLGSMLGAGGGGIGNLWKTLSGTGIGKWVGGLGPGQKILGGLGLAAVATPFIQKLMKTGPYAEEEEEGDWSIQPASIANLMGEARDYYRNYDPASSRLAYMPGKEYVNPTFYSAKGGRAGFFQGALADTAEGKPMSPGTTASGGYRNVNLGGGDGNIITNTNTTGDGTNVLQSNVVLEPSVLDTHRNVLTKNRYTEDEDDISNLYAEVEQKDIDASKMSGFKNQDYKSYQNQMELLGGTKVTPFEFKGLQEGTITEPGTYVATGAQGGLAKLANGGGVAEAQAEQMLKMEYQKYRNQGGTMSYQQFKMTVLKQAQGQGPMAQEHLQRAAKGGRIGYAKGKEVMPLLDMGGQEKDYRQDGGFVPIGREEKADDVPARLSKNEFVFTADAVRNAGGGDIDQGAQVMENVMKNLEEGGEISEESQGAQGMYNNMKQLETRIA